LKTLLTTTIAALPGELKDRDGVSPRVIAIASEQVNLERGRKLLHLRQSVRSRSMVGQQMPDQDRTIAAGDR
jgi:hypothetical protein